MLNIKRPAFFSEEGWLGRYSDKIVRMTRILMTISFLVQAYTTRDPFTLAAIGFLAAIYATLIGLEIFILTRPKKKKRSDVSQDDRRADRLSGEISEDEYERRREQAIRTYQKEIATIEFDYQQELVRRAQDAQEMRHEATSQ